MDIKNATQILARADALSRQYATAESRDLAVYDGYNGGGIAARVIGATIGCFIANVQEYRDISLALRNNAQELLSSSAPRGVLLAKSALLLEVRSDLRQSLMLKIGAIASPILTLVGRALNSFPAFAIGCGGLYLGFIVLLCRSSISMTNKAALLHREVLAARRHLEMEKAGMVVNTENNQKEKPATSLKSAFAREGFTTVAEGEHYFILAKL